MTRANLLVLAGVLAGLLLLMVLHFTGPALERWALHGRWKLSARRCLACRSALEVASTRDRGAGFERQEWRCAWADCVTRVMAPNGVSLGQPPSRRELEGFFLHAIHTRNSGNAVDPQTERWLRQAAVDPAAAGLPVQLVAWMIPPDGGAQHSACPPLPPGDGVTCDPDGSP